MLSIDWQRHSNNYDFIIVGSGYGGAITAARIAAAPLERKPSVCILERGREWPIRTFPDTADGVMAEMRSDMNPLGLYEILNYEDISVLKGSGLGGTSLINANVAAVPDREVFETGGWPPSLRYDALRPYYERARDVLGAGPHPRAFELKKVQAMDRRARAAGLRATPLDIAIRFDRHGFNRYRVFQNRCHECGDCTTGCNWGAKSTLYMNYLPMARQAGAAIFTQTKVERIEKLAGGGWRVHGKRQELEGGWIESFTMDAAHVILSAGSINSTEILMRSQMRNLKLSPRLGTGFTSNGDFFGLAYNGEYVTQVLGFGHNPDSPRGEFPPGPAIVSSIHYNGRLTPRERFTVEDLSFPSAFVEAAKSTFAALRGESGPGVDSQAQARRVKHDLDPLRRKEQEGALNHSMFYLMMGFDDAGGRMVWETPPGQPEGKLKIVWDQAGRQEVYTRLNEELRQHARAQSANFIPSPLWNVFDLRHLITAHPLGGCPIGRDHTEGVVDEYGRVFSGDGGVHEGLFVADGALVGFSIGVNPFLTISALAERIAERKVQQMQGNAYA